MKGRGCVLFAPALRARAAGVLACIGCATVGSSAGAQAHAGGSWPVYTAPPPPPPQAPLACPEPLGPRQDGTVCIAYEGSCRRDADCVQGEYCAPTRECRRTRGLWVGLMADAGMMAANGWYYSERSGTSDKSVSGSFASGVSQQLVGMLQGNPFSSTRRVLVMVFAGYMRVPGGPLYTGGPEPSSRFAPIPDLHLATFGPGGSIALAAPDKQWVALEGTLGVLAGTGSGSGELWIGMDATPWLAVHTRFAKAGPWSVQMVAAAGLGFGWLTRSRRSDRDAAGNLESASENLLWLKPQLRLGFLLGP